VIHEARIVPQSAAPAGRSSVDRQCFGVSRGPLWKETTLVDQNDQLQAAASATNIGVAGSPPGIAFPTSRAE